MSVLLLGLSCVSGQVIFFKSESCSLEEGGRGGARLGLLCLVDTGSSADCCLTLGSAAWLLIGPEASTSRRPSDQIQMWNERGRLRRLRPVRVSHGAERWGDGH